MLLSKLYTCACSATIVSVIQFVASLITWVASDIVYIYVFFSCIYFFFRHHTYKKVDGQVELTEVGPRFEMKGKLST